MDRFPSLSTKDYLIRKYSAENNLPIKTIEAVVNHQFDEANKALKVNASLELSGFGKFFFNYKKSLKIEEKYHSKIRVFSQKLLLPDLTDQKRASWQLKLDNTYKQLTTLEQRIKIYRDTHEQV